MPITKSSTITKRGLLSVVAVVSSVVVTHGVHLSKPLFSDDYFWYGLPDHSGWITRTVSPEPGIYRPFFAFWFAGTRWAFGLSPVAYHAFALVFLIAAALLVRALGLRIGVGNVIATTSGVVYGAYGALTLTTIWASAAASELAVACSLAAIVVLLGSSTSFGKLMSALLFCLALLSQESSIVTPALATIALLVPVSGVRLRRAEIGAAARKTAVLWLLGVAYVIVRFLSGSPPDSGPYAARLLGTHVLRNMRDLMQDAARFGAPFATPTAVVWDIGFWATIIGASLLVLKRGRPLPLAGLIWFVIACVPELMLTSHPMETYYLNFALVGLAFTLASLLRYFVRSQHLIVAIVICFVIVQFLAVQRYDDRSSINIAIRRSEALRKLAQSEKSHGDTLIVHSHCPQDREISRQGDLQRAVLAQPDLEVRFAVRRPYRC